MEDKIILKELSQRELLLKEISDIVAKLVYYDRLKDSDIPMGEIERMVNEGEITVAEIVSEFDKRLREYFIYINK